MADQSGTVGFIHQQLDIFRRQSKAIERGDLTQAKTAGDQLRRSMSGLVQVVHLSRNGGSFSPAEKDDIELMLAEIKSLQETSIKRIESRRDDLAELLVEFRKGRQLLTRYRSPRRSGGKFFDITG